MVERIVDFFQPYFADWGYVIVGTATLLENSVGAGLIVPGETLVLVGAFFSAMGVLDPVLVALVASVGGIVGDSIGYLIGRQAGRQFLDRFGHRFFLHRDRLVAAERFYAVHGGKTVFFGRFVPVVRSMGALLAGVSHMRYPRFFAYDAAGAIIWAIGHTVVGVLVGEQYSRFKGYLDGAGLVLGALLVTLILASWWRRRRKKVKVGTEAADKKIDDGDR